ncbi:uncharacterized protein Z518_08994 [Rhinocladiella mackenziei CBS 650.93]|uniref:Histidine kinase n=1 Tax=Rhinocladiella mackenziei CBS 650.93 TaxID=1442369 RepID=A0A0D2I635_9EURO|nr:uncharacterized protein Z518_08994 [Rhinocladiella mackenziei CBS 650.93]KIX01269.1 hypothetical protein Z518_08994 [Rhinocladiella mackenziei CBS 650.93]
MVAGDAGFSPSIISHTSTTSNGARHDALPAETAGLHIDLPHLATATEIALGTLSTLPTPLLVLSSLKTVILANSAAGRLFGIDQDAADSTVTDILQGQTLSQIGIDMVSDGIPIWVSWEKFLDNLARGLQTVPGDGVPVAELLPTIHNGATTPTASSSSGSRRDRSAPRQRTQKSQDTVVDVAISSYHGPAAPRHGRQPITQNKARSPGVSATCRMIISIWTVEGQRFFTLTFTSVSAHQPHKMRPGSQASRGNASTNSAQSSRSSQSQTPTSSASSSQVGSPAETPNTVSFPPSGGPGPCAASSTLTDFQKVLKMKNAMLNAIEIPLIAMWKDESVVFPNMAARRLLAVDADPTSENSYDFLSRFTPWSAGFARQLQEIDNPIISLCRTQKAFTSWHIGMIDEKTGKRSNFDVSGHPVFDEKTGEFLAGLIAFKDVTSYTEKIALQTAEKEEQFRLICDMMPQMCWTARADGYHDYFSQHWYDYTGLTPANSLGPGWKWPFHEDDTPDTIRRWSHSLATGDEFRTQYRCRRHDGEWRWMLGRALPLRDHKTGKILKWFGSCTDIQDIVDAKIASQRARQNLLDVLKHSQMTLWIIDREEKVTFFEGNLNADGQPKDDSIGMSIYDLLATQLDPGSIREFKGAVERTLNGTSDWEVCENVIQSRWFRSKLVPLKGKRGPNGVEDDDYIAGVIGIGTDVTQLRQKEQENIKLLANEAAAKEANKMKSNFLANMSHEIRTPIAGVLGMSELLMDTALDKEQSEFAQNIQRSANSLLTVINDILDFSKIESGRLDIEEVQFSLGVVLQDVAKMLSFAAQRKGLEFRHEINLGPSDDSVLLGDPGRVRQILTNLLTNSIKFTSDGYVRMSTSIISETTDTATIEFCIEDSGIGIEEEVKKRLFHPFSQADSSTARRFGGTGLGLTICKNLVDLMHGTIRLDSKLDSGTKATFRIPFKKPEYRTGSSVTLLDIGMMPDRLQSDLSLSLTGSSREEVRKGQRVSPPFNISNPAHQRAQRSSMAPTDPRAEPPVPEIQREQFHILVVEDNPVNQQIALKFIRALKFSANAVWNGKEALEYLLKATSSELTADQSKEYPVPSLILMDVQMPVLDGYHATHMLRHHAPFTTISAISRIPIVAMTASAIQGDREKCERAGMDDYMAKPVKRMLLEQTILKWVANGRSGGLARGTSETTTDLPKPPLARACTDHSSACSEHDIIAAEIFARHAKDSLANHASSAAAPHSATVAGKALARRSSISRSILETEIPGEETEGDREMRRAEAEDKARALRDAKLLSATENDHGQPPIAPTIMLDDMYSSSTRPAHLSTGCAQPAESRAGASPMALTEENVSLFNNAQDGTFEQQKMPSPKIESDGEAYPIPDIPGPPPEGLLPAVDLAGMDANAEALVQSLLESTPHSAHTIETRTGSEESGSSSQENRRNVGGLMPGYRQNSDWTTRTARPEKS